MILISLTILAPLIAAITILILRRNTFQLALTAALVSVFASISLIFSAYTTELVMTGLPNMPLRLIATPLTSLLSTVVAVISALVLVYAIGYMAEDKEKNRFFATMLLFIAAMQTLVLAGDWILLLSAWELIGLSSYLLIGFWYQKPGVKSAATRAFLVTRSADLGLYIAVFILISNTGSSDIASTLNAEGNTAIIAGILLLVAAMGKSAQTPFHDWLQRAMAGPTPVSALLHSATLVAAGAILLIRIAPMLPNETLIVIGIVGGVTAILTGLIALAESDLKRLLAASTSSQYGLMLLAVAAGVPLAALLHLVAHAAIKSALFLGAGVFQHSRNSTEFSHLKGVGKDRPRIFLGFSIAALALAGIPPLSGFFSKDAIIAATMASPYAWLFVPMALAGTLLTGAYIARALRIMWQGEAQNKSINGIIFMGGSLAGLVALIILLGLTFSPIESGIGGVLPDSLVAAAFGLTAAITGLVLGWFIPAHLLIGPLHKKASQGFQIAGGFDKWCVRPTYKIAAACEKLELRLYHSVLAIASYSIKIANYAHHFDKIRIDSFIFLIVNKTIILGSVARTLQSGLIHRELAITTIVTAGLIIFIIISVIIF